MEFQIRSKAEITNYPNIALEGRPLTNFAKMSQVQGQPKPITPGTAAHRCAIRVHPEPGTQAGEDPPGGAGYAGEHFHAGAVSRNRPDPGDQRPL